MNPQQDTINSAMMCCSGCHTHTPSAQMAPFLCLSVSVGRLVLEELDSALNPDDGVHVIHERVSTCEDTRPVYYNSCL